jgi:hypothetical protein
MEGQEVVTYLNALGAELERRGFRQPIDIMIVGGVYMVLHVHNRPSTEDIDFLFLHEHLDLTKLPLSKEEKAFRAAVKAVAKQHHLKQAWLNDDAGPFVKEYVADPVRTFWRAFGPLRVYFTDVETMLVYKLMGYSQKQQPDIYALCELLHVETLAEVQAIIDRLVPLKVQKDFGVEETLEELFE